MHYLPYPSKNDTIRIACGCRGESWKEGVREVGSVRVKGGSRSSKEKLGEREDM